jgi:hypothetical protein
LGAGDKATDRRIERQTLLLGHGGRRQNAREKERVGDCQWWSPCTVNSALLPPPQLKVRLGPQYAWENRVVNHNRTYILYCKLIPVVRKPVGLGEAGRDSKMALWLSICVLNKFKYLIMYLS